MSETWPSSLPTDILTDGFSQKARPNSIRTQMEAGLDKVRRRYTSEIVDSAVSMVMTFTQYSALEVFYNTTLQGGTLSFNFTDPADDTEYEYQFLDTPGYSSFDSYNYLVNMQWERIG